VKTTMLLALTACLMGCGSKDKGGSSKTAPTPATTSTTAATATATSVAVATATAASTVTAVAAATGTISLDLTGAVGLAMLKTGSGLDDFDLADGPALQKVNADGTLAPALKGGSDADVVTNFYVAPNGTTFLVGKFSIPPSVGAALGDGLCVLAKAGATGALTCVDSSLSSVNAAFKSPIQFDTAGAIFYTGRVESNSVLRKVDSTGKSTDLINSSVFLSDFLVQGDGSTVLRGITGASLTDGAQWARLVSASGALKTIAADIQQETMAIFPDGKLYLGENTPYGRIMSYDLSKGAMDAQPWTSNILSQLSEQGGFDATTYVAPINTNGDAWINNATSFVNTGKQEFAIRPYNEGGSNLYRYYPTCAQVATTLLKKAVHLVAAGDNLIVSGTDANGANKLVLVDATAATPVETDLLPNDEVEIYHLSYSTKTKTLRFDGLRFSDNAPITGAIDLGNSNKAMLAPTGGVKLSDFQSL